MSPMKLEALRLANLPDLAPQEIVERAAAFESYLIGTATSAVASAPDAVQADEQAPEEDGAPFGVLDTTTTGDGGAVGAARRYGASEARDRREAEEVEARELLIRRAFDQRRADVSTFMAAGMPEWLARAAAVEMSADTDLAGFLDKEDRLKDWHYFAIRFLRMRKDIRAPSTALRTTTQF